MANDLQSNKSLIKKATFEENYTLNFQRNNTLYSKKYRLLTHKSRIYDSLDDEDLKDEQEINNLYIDPNSSFSIIFEIFLFIFNIFSLFYFPLYLAINHKFCKNNYITFNFSINFIVELLNILDLFFGFFRAYYNWEEQLVLIKKKIALKYVSG